MSRRAIAVSAGAMAIALGLVLYTLIPSKTADLIEVPQVLDTAAALSKPTEFEQLAKSDPVAMLENCLVRYQREVKDGLRCTLDKEERVHGKLLPREEISLFVRGDVPEPTTNKTQIEVLMKWQSGAQQVLGSLVKGTLYVEEKSREQIITWRPDAPFRKEHAIDIAGSSARGASRYCIRDAGLYRSMLRTFKVWEQRKREGTLVTEYLGRKPIERAGGVECHIVKRTCRPEEVDSFELGGTPNREAIAQEGFAELTIMIDAERWLQVGTEARRANGELIGAYYFRGIELNPIFLPGTFDKDGLLKK
jgi:hypothetical protein